MGVACWLPGDAMKRTALIGLLLCFVAAVVVVGLWGDQRYQAILLSPEYGNGWMRVQDPPCKGCSVKRYPNCEKPYLNPLQCIVFPNRIVPGRVEYQDSGVRILVTAANLNDPDHGRTGVWNNSVHLSLRGKVLFQVIVWTKDPATRTDLSRIRAEKPCGPGIPASANGSIPLRYVAYKWFRMVPSGALGAPFPPNYDFGALLLEGDPARIRECTIDFADAIRSASRQQIPVLHLRTIEIAYWQRGIP